MASSSRVVQEFLPTQAGERVGYVASTEEEHTAVAALTLLMATIDDGGAQIKCSTYEYANKEYVNYTARGFLAVTAFRVMLKGPNYNLSDLSQITAVSSTNPSGLGTALGWVHNNPSHLISGNVDNRHKGQWINGDELIGVAKQQLTLMGAAESYPMIYYSLNNILLHEEYAVQGVDIDTVEPAADSSMNQVTESEIRKSDALLRKLSEIQSADELMRMRLSEDRDILPTELVENFRRSRLHVANLEQAVNLTADDMLSRWWVHLPVGSRPYGRTWPYMNPLEADESVAFGRELEDVNRGVYGPVVQELNRELTELKDRQHYAQLGKNVLETLHRAEQDKQAEPAESSNYPS